MGTTYTTALRSTFLATGSSASRSLRTKPSIHQDAMDSPGCCLPRIHTTRWRPRSAITMKRRRKVSTAALSSGDSREAGSGVHPGLAEPEAIQRPAVEGVPNAARRSMGRGGATRSRCS